MLASSVLPLLIWLCSPRGLPSDQEMTQRGLSKLGEGRK